jgi:hypothetical protein
MPELRSYMPKAPATHARGDFPASNDFTTRTEETR